jgi:hypothetical protein
MNRCLSRCANILWYIGLAMLVVGTMLVGEQSAFADTGTVEECTLSCSAQYNCSSEEGNVGDEFGQCMDTCTGNPNSPSCILCSKPAASCPNAYGVCSLKCTGRCCPSWCWCRGGSIFYCECTR